MKGKPVVVTTRGMLPELVTDGVTGFIARETTRGICQVLSPLVRDAGLRQAIGKAAHEMAHREYRAERQGEEMEDFYQKILAKVSVK